MKLTVETTYKNCKAYRAFVDQINGATMRHIPFHMTFAEWQWVWLSSGKWEERGNKGHQFCMARRGPDVGPYAVGNVDIKTQIENRQEAKPQVWSDESRNLVSERFKGKPKSKETRMRMSEANKRRNAKPPTRYKAVEIHGVTYPTWHKAQQVWE